MTRIFTVICLLFLNAAIGISQTDTIPPVLICSAKNMYYQPGGLLTVWPQDFIDSLHDNQSENQNIELRIRKSCTGYVIPENSPSTTYWWGDKGLVDIWARDEAGNTSVCSLEFHINTLLAEQNMIMFNTPTVAHDTIAGQKIWHVQYHVTAGHCILDSLSFDLDEFHADQTTFSVWSFPTAGYTSRIVPAKNTNPLNGVTTHDLLLISRHILGIEPLDSPYKILAADANQDGKVTFFDIVTLRKLILGFTDELPNGKSWRFIPKSHVFSNPADPFLDVIPDYLEIPASNEFYYLVEPGDFLFRGIKIGDVDFSADPSQ